MPINLKELADAFSGIENDLGERRYVDTRDGKIHFFRAFDEDLTYTAISMRRNEQA